jgi:predicted nicotinamide N-methyase
MVGEAAAQTRVAMTEPDDTRCTRFVRENTVPISPALLPELTLHLARQPFEIFQAAQAIEAERPYWAFAWTGGQGLARWLLDHPAEVVDKRILDVGAGSALAVIAALQAGARSGLANDTDPHACAAARLNATANSVELAISAADLLGGEPDADLILIGDLFYEPELATRVTGFLERAARRGTTVLFGDRATMQRPPLSFEMIAEYTAPLTPDLQIDYVETARIWRLARQA